MIDLPDVRQHRDYDCGPACVASVLRHFGAKAPLGEVRDALQCNGYDGTHPAVIENYLRNLCGFRICAGEMEPGDLIYHTRRGRPVILIACGHYIVCRGATAGHAYIQDPDSGRRRMPMADLVANWADRHRHGATYDQFGIAVLPPR